MASCSLGGLTRAAAAEVIGGGPEDPVADAVGAGAIVGGLGYAAFQYLRSNLEVAEPAGKCPTADEIKGKTVEQIDKEMKDNGWVAEPTREGERTGTRYGNPDKRGEPVQVMPGKATDPNPVKQGPYARVSSGGTKTDPIPLPGNPTLNP